MQEDTDLGIDDIEILWCSVILEIHVLRQAVTHSQLQVSVFSTCTC